MARQNTLSVSKNANASTKEDLNKKYNPKPAIFFSIAFAYTVSGGSAIAYHNKLIVGGRQIA
jgi:hypothetical protein